jgi:hypothetical protein
MINGQKFILGTTIKVELQRQEHNILLAGTLLLITNLIFQEKYYNQQLTCEITSDVEKIITESFEYDNNLKLLKHWHQISGQPQELLTDNTYNAMYQLTNKKVGGTLGNPLQNIDYQYNVRGWLTKINDPQNLNGKLFGYEIKYNNPSNIAAIPKYNGNISEVD